MPRVCTVCAHPERLAIEKAVLAGAAVTRAHGRSTRAIANHADRHRSRRPLKATDVREAQARATASTTWPSRTPRVIGRSSHGAADLPIHPRLGLATAGLAPHRDRGRRPGAVAT